MYSTDVVLSHFRRLSVLCSILKVHSFLIFFSKKNIFTDSESSTVSESSNASSTVKKNGRGKENPFLRENGKVLHKWHLYRLLHSKSLTEWFFLLLETSSSQYCFISRQKYFCRMKKYLMVKIRWKTLEQLLLVFSVKRSNFFPSTHDPLLGYSFVTYCF